MGERTGSGVANLVGLELRSLVDQRGALKLWLEEVPVVEPGDDEVVVRVDAAPLNPSDILLMLGPVDLGTLRVGGTTARPEIEAQVPQDRLSLVAGRLGQALPVGNEGAGVVVMAGRGAAAFMGRTVAIRPSSGSYA